MRGFSLLLMAASAILAATLLPDPAPPRAANPDLACASCHRALYDRYEKTPMARASGPAVDGILSGSFQHRASGVAYKVFLENGSAMLSYDRPAHGEQDKPLEGREKLAYFVGSGKRGRTYLYQTEGRWFQTPINWYSRKSLWDMLPGYGNVTAMPSGLIVDASCLHCHATGVRTPLPDARNHFAGEPSAQAGIGCAACHGDGAAHIATGGKSAIANPARMGVAARDSVCLSCHLEGEVAVFREGKSATSFHVGDDLFASAAYFVQAGAQGGAGRAVSQYEALLRSACKRASGDRITCTTCHDAHDSPGPDQRVTYFRQKCLQCHAALATNHHAEQPSCSACHMAQRNPGDVAHEQTIDHDIERQPAPATAPPSGPVTLVRVGNAPVSDRERGLAYASFARRGDRSAGEKALSLLRQVEDAGDIEVQTELGYLDQRAGDPAAAAQAYTRALAVDPYSTSALGNLGVIAARAGHVDQAVALLRRAVEADPTQTAAGLNLAFILCTTGDQGGAQSVLGKVRVYAPDDAQLRNFLEHGEYAGGHCRLK